MPSLIQISLFPLLLFLFSCSTFQGPGSWRTIKDRPPLFDWPLDKGTLTQSFSRNRPHMGIDLAAKQGTPIYASQRGTVIYTGQGFRGYGRLVIIEGQKSWSTFYAHLHRIKVKQGARVNIGDLIGTVGRTGRASGPHLHFEIRYGKTPLNPIKYLPYGRELAGYKR